MEQNERPDLMWSGKQTGRLLIKDETTWYTHAFSDEEIVKIQEKYKEPWKWKRRGVSGGRGDIPLFIIDQVMCNGALTTGNRLQTNPDM